LVHGLAEGRPLGKLIRWAEVLRIPEEVLWFKLPPGPSGTVEDVNRHGFLRTAAITAATATSDSLMALLSQLDPTSIPVRIGDTEIEQVRSAAQTFLSWDNRYGGGLVRETVAAQLRYAVTLLDAQIAPGKRSDLLSAVGFLGHTAGFMAFDAYAHNDAHRMFQLARICAEAAGDWHLRAKVLSSTARQAIWCGRPADGLATTEQAFVRADRLTATERAMLHTTQARALAKMGRVQDAVTAIGRADDEFAHADPAVDPVWMRYYDHAQHFGDTGHALFDLAIGHGRFVTDANERLAAAVRGHKDAFIRSRAISATKLATLIMATADPAEAAAVGEHALTDAGHLRSRRAVDDLRDLRRLAATHPTQPEVADLSQHIDTLLATA
jgi:hypothetical protein